MYNTMYCNVMERSVNVNVYVNVNVIVNVMECNVT